MVQKLSVSFLPLSALLLLGAVVLGQAQGKNLGQRVAGTLLPDYNCFGKEDGYYPHPQKCAYFVDCRNGSDAYEMECSDGLDGDGRLQKLHYVAESGPDPTTARCDDPEIARCGPEPTTTTTTTTTTPAPESCKVDECQLDGCCRNYTKCVPDFEGSSTGHLQDLKCGEDLFWDPSVSSIHGGTCNYFASLPQKTKDEYENDPHCIPPCEWSQTLEQECTGEYTYRTKFNGTTEPREKILNCPTAPPGSTKLVWSNDERLSCVKCTEAKHKNGESCLC